MRLKHPNSAIGYNLDAPYTSLCIVTDHEHRTEHLDEDVVQFAERATVLIRDAPYQHNEKLNENAGWDHSSRGEVAQLAKRDKLRSPAVNRKGTSFA